jgi:hypothetical protein
MHTLILYLWQHFSKLIKTLHSWRTSWYSSLKDYIKSYIKKEYQLFLEERSKCRLYRITLKTCSGEVWLMKRWQLVTPAVQYITSYYYMHLMSFYPDQVLVALQYFQRSPKFMFFFQLVTAYLTAPVGHISDIVQIVWDFSNSTLT